MADNIIFNSNVSAKSFSIDGTSIENEFATKEELATGLSGKAATNHGYHVPTPQTANNTTFLRNDNSWQKVTYSAIGAAAATHEHNASEISSGELSSNRLPIVPIIKGGTGQTTALGSEYAICGGITEASTAVSDDTQIVYKVTSPNATSGVFRYRKTSDLWTYIKGKSDSTYANKTHSHTELEWMSF